MANPLLGSLSLDDVLAKFKVYDRYHGVTILLLTVGAMFEFAWYCNHVLIAEKVEYRCIEFSSDLTNIRSIIQQNHTISSCKNYKLCSKWVYDKPDSLVAEFQLACQEWKRTLIGSAHTFGYMFGILIVGLLSDRFGRKTLVIITGITGGALGCLKSFATSYWLYVGLEFLEAAIGDPLSPIYTLVIEMTDSRVTYTTIVKAGLGIGGVFLALAAWLIPYWRTLLKIVYAPGLLAIFFIYFLDESPRWLLANGKKMEALKIIRNAAKLNNMEIAQNLNTIWFEQDKGPSFATVMRDTFKSPSLMRRFFVCSVWWTAGTFVNFGLIINSTLLGGNKYFNFGLSAAAKCLGNLVTGYIVYKFSRKGPLIACFVACAVLCTGQPFLPTSLLWLQITNYMAGLLLSCITLCIIYLSTSELFPTQSRNSMHALCSGVGRVSAVLAPQTPLLMPYWAGLPTLTFGVVALTGGLVTLLVPDTADQCLPDTVCEAEEMEIIARERRLGHCSN